MEGALVVAEYLRDNGALTKLDISSNYIAAAQGEDLQRICAGGGIDRAHEVSSHETHRQH
jgi:hypothetical protein